MQQTNSQLQDQNTVLKAQLTTGASFLPEAPIQNHDSALEHKLKQLVDENKEKEDELERLRKDQEDLLELLTDQECKLNMFKNRLRELGETIDEGDSDNNSVASEGDNES